MNLDRVTMTGADDSVKPSDLVAISKEFPFVEWGILVSRSQVGVSRFPSIEWLLDFEKEAVANGLNVSLHICGAWIRQIIAADRPPAFVLNLILQSFSVCCQRVQLNFHGERIDCPNPGAMSDLIGELFAGKQVIFQNDGGFGMEYFLNYDQAGNSNGVVLFDLSHGAGVLPEEWPKQVAIPNSEDYAYRGYAGGLGPDNLTEQIPLIAKAANGARFWIDMETKIRSDNDRRFDLAKVRRCLEIAKPFVKS